jgi:tetratricopeptide (TPR) repeat protein
MKPLLLPVALALVLTACATTSPKDRTLSPPPGTAPAAVSAMQEGNRLFAERQWQAARTHYETAIQAQPTLAEAHYNSGFVAVLEYDRATADGRFTRALELYEDLGDRRGAGYANWGLAVAAVQARDLDTAANHAEKGLRAFEEVGDWYGASLGRWIEFQVARFKGDWDLAREKMASFLDYTREGDIVVISYKAGAKAEIELASGDSRRAVELAAAYETLADRYGGRAPQPLMELSDHRELARAYLSEEEIQEAWREGCELTPDDIVARATKDTT